MGNIKQPSELVVNNVFKVLIYGQPGIGKSTVALSAPNPVLLDFDGGANRINGAHQVPTLQVNSWDEVLESLGNGDLIPFSTIVIDTAGKMLDFMAKYIFKIYPKYKKADGTLSLQGFGVRKTMFANFLSQCYSMRKNVVFVAHEKEDKDNDKRFIRPDVGSASNLGDLIKELDLVGYMRADGYNRKICWTGTDEFYGKNTCNLPAIMDVPQILDENGFPVLENNLLANVFASYNAYLNNQRMIRVKFDTLMERTNAAIEKIDSLEAANDFWGKVQTVTPVWNSRVATKMALDAKCASLGFKFNEMTNAYEAA